MGPGTRWASQSNQIHVEADPAGSKWVKVNNHCHAVTYLLMDSGQNMKVMYSKLY